MAQLAWKVKGSADEARSILREQQQFHMDSQPFWNGYLGFEIDQPTNLKTEAEQYDRVKTIHNDIRRKSHLPPDAIRELSQRYLAYLTQRGGKDAAEEYMDLDAEVNGSASIVPGLSIKNSLEAKAVPRQTVTNGHVAAS